MKTQKYKLLKEKTENEYIDMTLADGLIIKPKSKINNGIAVVKMNFYKNYFTFLMLNKKIKKKLKIYLQYIMEIYETEDGEENARMALGDIEKYKAIINNRYQAYLDEKYLNILNKKIELFELEITKKYKTIKRKKQVKNLVDQKTNEKVGKSR